MPLPIASLVAQNLVVRNLVQQDAVIIAIGVATIRARAPPTSTTITLLTLPLILTSLTTTLIITGRTTDT